MKSDHSSAEFAFGTGQTRPLASPRPQTGELRGFLERLSYALGPLGVGFILDALDLATFGPIGLCLGALVGGYAGWILSKHEGIDRNLRIAFAICAAAYMTIPFTEAIPAATILVMLARFYAGPRAELSSTTERPYEPTAEAAKSPGFSRKDASAPYNQSPC